MAKATLSTSTVHKKCASTTIAGFPADDVVVIENGENDRVVVHLHGATILSWTCDGVEQLFLSSKAVFDNKKAIRGGIPLVFPVFGPWAVGAQHGFARIKRWTNTKPAKQDLDGAKSAVFMLEHDADTRHVWNYKFRIEYTVTLFKGKLMCQFDVHNLDECVFDYFCLFHTYFRVPDVHKAYVEGLQDLYYTDKVAGTEMIQEKEKQVYFKGETDRIYEQTGDKFFQRSDKSRILIETVNLPDIVLWNPWEAKSKAMADMDDNGWEQFVCVESGQVSSAIILETATSCSSWVTYKVLNRE